MLKPSWALTLQDQYRGLAGENRPGDTRDKDNPFMEYGRNAEKHLIALFALDHPQYKVTANPNYEVIYHPKHSFVAGTLDGYLAEKETGRKGVLEIKTTEILNSMHREKWNDKVPDNYYIQVLHYLLSTGWDFAVLKAQLKTVYGDDVRLNTRHLHRTVRGPGRFRLPVGKGN